MRMYSSFLISLSDIIVKNRNYITYNLGSIESDTEAHGFGYMC